MKGMIMFKKALKVGAFAAALALPGFAFGQAAPAADAKPAEAKPSYTLTGNFGFFSQYVFRGLTQSGHQPAAQGGFDFAHESGFYAGTWASNISWLKENQTSAAGTIAGLYGSGGSLEWDFYGGYKWNLPNDFVLDLGTLYYYYPGSVNGAAISATALNVPNANSWEIYASPSWKWLSFKASYSVSDKIFGVDKAGGTYYLDLSANPPIGDTGLTANLHWGYQKYKGTDPRNPGGLSNDALDSYKDVKIGLSYALPKDFTVGAFYTKALSYNKLAYGSAFSNPQGPFPYDQGQGTGTVFIQKTF
jgi:uncharacterized protein (TIGR02001 family)